MKTESFEIHVDNMNKNTNHGILSFHIDNSEIWEYEYSIFVLTSMLDNNFDQIQKIVLPEESGGYLMFSDHPAIVVPPLWIKRISGTVLSLSHARNYASFYSGTIFENDNIWYDITVSQKGTEKSLEVHSLLFNTLKEIYLKRSDDSYYFEAPRYVLWEDFVNELEKLFRMVGLTNLESGLY
jgi:hypothetical protein